MALALYRKYRSRRLADIVGQSHVTDILARAIERDAIAHAYLFTGPRGVGKTSIARILAHEINKLPYDQESGHLDIIEIDAASNNGVDDIRELREKVQLAPTHAEKKIYIIDEVHMLSKPAFNALLKTLEEPPEHVVFILATTDADKLPETIVSRTQRFSFKKASQKDLIHNLTRIAKAEKISIDEDALALIAEQSEGSYRDSVSLLDQLQHSSASSNTITAADVEATLGLPPHTKITTLLDTVVAHEFDKVIKLLKVLDHDGSQPHLIARRAIAIILANTDRYKSLLPLVNELVTVGSSPMPYARLLTSFGMFSDSTKKRSAPTLVSIKQTDPVVEALVKKATEPKPKDDIVVPTTAKAALIAEKPKKKLVTKKTAAAAPLEWAALLASTKEASIALHSVLQKSAYDIDGTTLALYCRNDFYKKKLDTPKFRQHLGDALMELTGTEWDIETIPGSKPSENSQIAAVAAMMGGGEEVSVEALGD